MEGHLNILKKLLLFDGINEDDIEKLLNCLNPTFRGYEKNEIVFAEGDVVPSIGIILSGAARIIRTDFSGNTNVAAELYASDIFGEAFICAGIDKSDITVRAAMPLEIMFIDYEKIIVPCSSECSFHSKLVFNLLKTLAYKNRALDKKLEILSQRTTRDKLFTYFYAQAKAAGENSFSIPYSRAELADFLCVDRSALSRELCKMRDDGFLEFYKNSFILKEQYTGLSLD